MARSAATSSPSRSPTDPGEALRVPETFNRYRSPSSSKPQLRRACQHVAFAAQTPRHANLLQRADGAMYVARIRRSGPSLHEKKDRSGRCGSPRHRARAALATRAPAALPASDLRTDGSRTRGARPLPRPASDRAPTSSSRSPNTRDSSTSSLGGRSTRPSPISPRGAGGGRGCRSRST